MIQVDETAPGVRDGSSNIPSISRRLADFAAQYPGHPALRFEGRVWTYAALEGDVSCMAAALLAEGAGPDARICYIGKNSAHYFILLYAAARIGAVLVPIGWRLSPAEMRYILEDSEAHLLFAGREFIETATDLAEQLSPTPKVIGLECWPGGDAPPLEPVTADRDPDPDRVFVQLYTSGTTGRPKGVMLSARNFFGRLARSNLSKLEWDRWEREDIVYVAMPIAHVGGTGFGIRALFSGTTAFIEREFSPERLLDAISTHHVNRFFVVPAALQQAIRSPGARDVDFSRIKHVLYGASPMPLPLLREAIDVLNVGMCQQYGLTETAGTIVVLPPEDHVPEGNERMKSAGKPLPGIEVRIVDGGGRQLPVRSIGEVSVRSDSNMKGYWKLPKATVEAIDSDGWLRTGDVGFLDEDGYLYICDRLKDMICSGGENVYAAEVESVLAGHPAVAEVAVIGVPDETWGEAVKAVVVERAGQPVDAADLISFARGQLAGFKLPKTVDIVAALPRNSAGKVMKTELRRPYWEGRDRQVN